MNTRSRLVALFALLISSCSFVAAPEVVARREIQAQIDASIEADRRKDLASRLELFTPDYTVTLLDGQVLDRADLESGIRNFHRGTIAFGADTRVTIERLELDDDVATVYTNQHLVRTVPGNGSESVERVSNIRHRETWVRTPEGWKIRAVEETEQGPVTVNGEPVHVDTAGIQFVRMIRQQGVGPARAKFNAQRARGARPFFDEATLNAAGYSFLAAGRTSEAIEIFRMNAEAYPASANVHDSLGEAYAAAHDEARAVESYQKTLELTPTDDRVVAILARLHAPVSIDEHGRMLLRVMPEDVDLLPNVVYQTTGPDRALRLHVVRAKGASERMPALVFIHGGGWSEGSKERGLIALLDFVRRGYVGVPIEYRFASEATFPAQIQDVKCAIRFLRANADRFGIDPGRIAVWGQSAGGHLAALAGTSGDVAALEGECEWAASSRPDLVIDWNGPTDLLDPAELQRLLVQKEQQRAPSIALERLFGGPVTEHHEAARVASPITWVSADDPPFLIMHGETDDAVAPAQSRAFYERLRAAGVDATLRIYPGESHFGVNATRPLFDRHRDEMLTFLARHFQ